ncbi:MAG: trypsin-like peptidase domain-containing protein, partial [Caldisericia bacterium]|nr:trypsin-like peptidase domain-containing protein [Caldisericia bacterium]
MDSVLYYKNKSAILEQKINTLQDENDNLRKQIEELNYEKNNMVIQNNILQNKVFELDKENNTLKEQINILNKKLEEYQNKYSNRETGNDIFENNKFKIVSIENYDNKGNLKGRGTGFVATDNGKVITNFHVIENANYVIVKFMDDRNYKINGLINYDINRDLAILKLPIDLIEPIKIGDSDKIKVGDEIILISNPLGLNLTLTNGVISYVNRIINNQTFIQYTAPSSPGSSGGPLFNLNGEVIGVVNSKIVLEGVEGINFAIPINDVKLLLKEEKPIEFNKIFSQSYSSWDLSDDKILEAINLGKKYYNDTIKLIEMFSIYSISYSLITTKTNVTVMTPYFWIAYNTAENMKSGKDITIKDAYSFLKNYGNQLDFLLLIYGNSIDFYKYYSVKLYI